MSTRLFLLLSVVAAFIQSPILPPVFLEGLLVVFVITTSTPRKTAPALFVSGLVFDLIQNQTLGISSAIFLITAFLIRNTKDNLAIQRPWVLSAIALLINTARFYFVFEYTPFLTLAISALVAFLAFRTFWVPNRGMGLTLRQ